MDSLSYEHPPEGLNPHLQALWWEKNGDWDRAHRIVQGLTDRMAACIHAYLHYREGDVGNAHYWEHRAGNGCPESESLEELWQRLVEWALVA